MTTIVEYGAGNLRSVVRALEVLGETAVVASSPDEIRKAERLILPGVGSFDVAINGLRESGALDVLEKKVLEEKTPILGICLGFQLFTRSSEEGELPGLGWIAGETKRFLPSDGVLHVPHIGWNEVNLVKECGYFRNLPTNPCLYFAHSYYVTCDDPLDVVATSSYGRRFVSVAQKENIFGVQFHPERSQHLGLQLLADFLRDTACEGTSSC